jgi:hypothetical protein
MGTVHVDGSLNELLNGMAEDEERDGVSNLENSTDDELYDALTTIDEDYPFQPLAPPLVQPPRAGKTKETSGPRY